MQHRLLTEHPQTSAATAANARYCSLHTSPTLHLYGHMTFPSELLTATTVSPHSTAPLASAGLPGTIPATTTLSAFPEESHTCSRISPGGLWRTISYVWVTDSRNLSTVSCRGFVVCFGEEGETEEE